MEKESEIDYYKLGIGRAEGDDSVYIYRSVGAGVNSHRAMGKFTQLTTTHTRCSVGSHTSPRLTTSVIHCTCNQYGTAYVTSTVNRTCG